MRGKETVGELYGNHQGITPAYAGKSFNVAFVRVTFKDHPRVCGEKHFSTVFALKG